METGDPTNLFSNLFVLYAMYFVSYPETVKKSKIIFVKVTRGLVFVIGFICFIGWIEIITIKEVNEQYYLAISEEMKLENQELVNVHHFIIFMGIKMSVFAAVEWLISFMDKNKLENEKLEEKAKGA